MAYESRRGTGGGGQIGRFGMRSVFGLIVQVKAHQSAVPDLTFCTGIKLNARVALRTPPGKLWLFLSYRIRSNYLYELRGIS